MCTDDHGTASVNPFEGVKNTLSVSLSYVWYKNASDCKRKAFGVLACVEYTHNCYYSQVHFVHFRISYMGWIDMFKNCSYSIELCAKLLLKVSTQKCKHDSLTTRYKMTLNGLICRDYQSINQLFMLHLNSFSSNNTQAFGYFFLIKYFLKRYVHFSFW